MYYFYVLYSLHDKKLYKGVTSNIVDRFNRHNQGRNKSTSYRIPFVIIHLEQFQNKGEAYAIERFYKSLEGGSKLKDQLTSKFPTLF